LSIGENMIVRLEPQLPYIYMPTSVYQKFADFVNVRFQNKFKENVCNYSTKTCMIPQPCKDVDIDIFFTFKLDDGYGNKFAFGVNPN